MTLWWQKRWVQGALWKALAALCFSANNGLVKAMGSDLPMAQVAFLSHSFGVLWLLPFVWMHPEKALMWRRRDLHIWRVILSVLGGAFVVYGSSFYALGSGGGFGIFGSFGHDAW